VALTSRRAFGSASMRHHIDVSWSFLCTLRTPHLPRPYLTPLYCFTALLHASALFHWYYLTASFVILLRTPLRGVGCTVTVSTISDLSPLKGVMKSAIGISRKTNLAAGRRARRWRSPGISFRGAPVVLFCTVEYLLVSQKMNLCGLAAGGGIAGEKRGVNVSLL